MVFGVFSYFGKGLCHSSRYCTPSLIDHSSKCITSARSAFYSLQGVGSRFGCLHVCTSLKVFKSISLPLLLFGCEVLFPPKSLITMLERCQLSILRVILGLLDGSLLLPYTIWLGHCPLNSLFTRLICPSYIDFSHYLMMLSPNLYFCGDMPNIPQKGSAIKSLTFLRNWIYLNLKIS